MVLTQLQLKWPDHSTHLLTRLKYLLQNEQLVDCTLMCNKHSLKVHRSVLAACSPYFERELENNPYIIIKDMQFNVLQALIEFMYFGETHITEENLSPLIKAAKLYEVKGLSEMDLLFSNEDNVISSVIEVSNCVVENPRVPNRFENVTFENSTKSVVELKPHLENQEDNLYSEKYFCSKNKSNCNDVNDTTNEFSINSSRNFVVTPPQAESAQILLSLARSCSQAHNYYEESKLAKSEISFNENTNQDICPNDCTSKQRIIFNEVSQVSSCDTINMKSPVQCVDDNISNKQNFELIQDNSQLNENEISYCGQNANYNNSDENLLLVKMIDDNQPIIQYDENLKDEFKKEFYPNKNDNLMKKVVIEKNITEKQRNLNSQTNIILECPFLIETNAECVNVPVSENIAEINKNVLNMDCKNLIKLISSDEIHSTDKYIDHNQTNSCIVNSGSSNVDIFEIKADNSLCEIILERIKEDTMQTELKNDPEAVILCKVNERGELEKYILSSNDVNSLKEFNKKLRSEKANLSEKCSPMTEYEVPLTNKSVSLITQIFDCGEIKVDNAISKLPFKKTGYVDLKNDDNYVYANNENVQFHSASLSIDPHQHENMFEELDNQFNVDCSIENIQREYVAYEEASKNETQLEHNYYANALKDEDEECIGISSSYNLETVMMVDDCINLNEDNIVIFSENKSKCKTNFESLNELQTANTENSYLNNCQFTENVSNSRIENPDLCFKNQLSSSGENSCIKNNKKNLTSKNKIFTNSVLRIPSNKMKISANDSLNNFRNFRTIGINNFKRNLTESVCGIANSLPFKKVKSNVTTVKNSPLVKKPKRVYKKRINTLKTKNIDHTENLNHNSIDRSNENLIEEIIVDEIS